MTPRLIAVITAELAGRIGKPLPEIEPGTRFKHDLRCDTIDMVCITLSVEDAFDIRLPVEVENCETVQDMEETFVAPVYAPVRSDRGSLVAAAETWHVKVVDPRLVPAMFLEHPSVLEAIAKVIAPVVRGKNGLRSIEGCEIYSETKASVR